jgi:endonuclease YncB( thermonuclease family)
MVLRWIGRGVNVKNSRAFLFLGVILGLVMPHEAFALKVCKVLAGDMLQFCPETSGPNKQPGAVIRLWGIDAPDYGQPGFEASRKHLETLVRGQTVEVMCDHPVAESTRARPVQCSVYRLHEKKGLANFNELMVFDGWAFDWREKSYGAFWGEEQEAKKEKKGLWSQPDGGVRPWVFRAQKGKKK